MVFKGRLIPQALYSKEDFNIHYVRACIKGENPFGDLNDYEKSYNVFLKGCRKVDPDGDGCLALLRDLEKGITE